MARSPIKLSAFHTALALAVNAQLAAEEKDKEITRFRFSRQMLRSVSGWKRISEVFLRELFDELGGLGWTAVELSDTELAAIKTSKINVWPKLGGRSVMKLVDDRRHLASAVEDAYTELFGSDEDDLLD